MITHKTDCDLFSQHVSGVIGDDVGYRSILDFGYELWFSHLVISKVKYWLKSRVICACKISS